MAQRLPPSVPWGGRSGATSGLGVGIGEEDEELWGGLLLGTDGEEGMFSNRLAWPQLQPLGSVASDGAT